MSTDDMDLTWSLRCGDVFERVDVGGVWAVVAINRGARVDPVPYVELESVDDDDNPPRRERVVIGDLLAKLARKEAKWMIKRGNDREEAERILNRRWTSPP